ncbi:dihydrofolate reductase family protein [Catelliglobosispora koreensis]|uniref:dihydrofolate reductase family protein n=1 Tax=Catelliglobosispora koreensis TaxID=129052 RepID=UPI000364E25E|nr:dihydrofolate reductase family protein [Catelliglobosispora koreensis]
MRIVIVHEYVSVDGFAADAEGGLDWAAVGGDVDRRMLQELDGIDTMVLGARTYEIFAGFWPTPESKSELIADKLNGLRKVVFSTTLAAAPWGDWPAAELDASGRPAERIAQLKQEPGQAIVVWGSISLAQSLVKAGVVDEIWLGVAPVALGQGRPLFPERLDLRLSASETFADTGIMMLKYQVTANAT